MKEFIEKLIGRLEENGQKMCETKSSVPFGKHSPANHRYYKAISVKKAIFIINQLAEEYKQDIDTIDVSELLGEQVNDFCEWERNYGFVSDKYKVETACGYTFYDLHHAEPFKICPYCGKKIKIAPYQPKGEAELYRAKSIDGEYQEYNGDWN